MMTAQLVQMQTLGSFRLGDDDKSSWLKKMFQSIQGS